MRIEGTYTFAIPMRQLQATLGNPDILARALPGCERLTQMGPADAQGSATYEVRLRMQPDKSPIQATLRVARPSERELRVDVRGLGPSGPLSARGTMTLAELEHGRQTQGTYAWELLPVAGAPLTSAQEANGANGKDATGDRLITEFHTRLETLARTPSASGGTGPLLAETARGRILRQSAGETSLAAGRAPARVALVGLGALLAVGALVIGLRLLRRGRA